MADAGTLRTGFFAFPLLLFGYLLVLIARPFATALLLAMLLAVLLAPGQRRFAPRIGENPTAPALVGLAVGAVGAVGAALVVAAPRTSSSGRS